MIPMPIHSIPAISNRVLLGTPGFHFSISGFPDFTFVPVILRPYFHLGCPKASYKVTLLHPNLKKFEAWNIQLIEWMITFRGDQIDKLL